MSFIELTGIEFEVNEDPSNKKVFLNLVLNNQHEKLYLERVGEESNTFGIKTNTIFFIEAMSCA